MNNMAFRPTVRNEQEHDEDFEENVVDSTAGYHRPQAKKQLLKEIGARWYWIALCAILGVLAAGYYLSKKPKQYTATSTLLFKQQVTSVLNSQSVDSLDARTIEGLNTIAERLRRLELLERVAARPDVRNAPGLIPQPVQWMPEWVQSQLKKPAEAGSTVATVPPPADLAEYLATWMKVSIRRGTRLVDVSFTHPVPEVTKLLADGVVREYLEESAIARSDDRNSSINLLQKESDESRKRLEVARGALATYARALEVLKLLDEKETAYAALARRYLPKHPKMATAADELAHQKMRFIEEFEIARKSVSDKAYWDSSGNVLPLPGADQEGYLRLARQQLLARSSVLENEIESATSVFNSMLTLKEEAGVNQGGDQAAAEINNLSRLPGYPSGPVANKIYGMGGVGGFGVGLAIAFLLVRMDNKFHTVSQLSAESGATVLAAISHIKVSELATALADHRKKYPNTRAPELQREWDDHLVFRLGTSSTVYAEMYRVLRASISLLGDESLRKITLFTSAVPGEGKTSTSANFALAAAAQGRRTLLIDLDLRKPSVHEIFGLSRDQGDHGGVTECLANLADFDKVILKQTGQENLHLMLSGKRAPNPGELLNGTRLRALLAQACREYDVVVLDTAPILAVPDTRIIAPLVHNVCLVVRADYTPKGAVRRVLDVLEEDNTKISGMVFNGFVQKRRRIADNYTYGYYGGGGYGAYGAYGVYGDDDSGSSPRKKNKRRLKQR